ncbi:MAG: carbohydrate-binding domain-containing protein [Clostridium sp.]
MKYQNVFKRYEFKYLITRNQQKLLLEVINDYMEPDQFGRSTIGVSLEDMFSNRDKEIGYSNTDYIEIKLSDNNISCDSKAVSVANSIITISDEGTYVISGSLSNGQIIVDAEKTDKVQLVLNGTSINCNTSAPLYIKQADKVFVTLEKDSENVLSNKEEFVAIDDNNIDSVIYSKDDLTLNGLGTLTVNAAYGHGIVSKDDLVITSGTFNITTGGGSANASTDSKGNANENWGKFF